jgi:hypothetical protein
MSKQDIKRIKNEDGVIKEMELPLGTRPPEGWNVIVDFATSDLDTYVKNSGRKRRSVPIWNRRPA